MNSCKFKARHSILQASLETFFGLGLIVGPTVGGALYQVCHGYVYFYDLLVESMFNLFVYQANPKNTVINKICGVHEIKKVHILKFNCLVGNLIQLSKQI